MVSQRPSGNTKMRKWKGIEAYQDARLINAQVPHTCATCLQTLRDDSRLRNALNKDLPINKNFKYVNKKFNGKSDAKRYAKTEGLLELIRDPVRVHILSSHRNVLWLSEF